MRRTFEVSAAAWFAIAAWVLATFLMVNGCGGVKEHELPKTGATLEGALTLNGKPIPAAMIIVVGGSASATGNADGAGRYRVDNAPIGSVKIGVNTEAAKGQLMGQMMAAGVKKEKGDSAPPPPTIVDVPAKFADPETSGITTTVQQGPNTFDIELK